MGCTLTREATTWDILCWRKIHLIFGEKGGLGLAWLGLAITYKYDLPVVCLILFGRRQARPSQVAELYLYGNC